MNDDLFHGLIFISGVFVSIAALRSLYGMPCRFIGGHFILGKSMLLYKLYVLAVLFCGGLCMILPIALFIDGG
ncbi:hypothetical protein GGR77_001131 [Xanthomonas translucens]